MRRASRQKGAITVEFGLVLPILLVMVLALAHFAGLVSTKQRLSDAANYAARAVSLRNGDTALAEQIVRQRLGSSSDDCLNLSVNAAVLVDDAGFESLRVDVGCQTKPIIDSENFKEFGSRHIEVSAVMPL